MEMYVKFVEVVKMMKTWNNYLNAKLIIVFQYVKAGKEIEEI